VTAATATAPETLPDAGAVMARAGSENFPVASRVLPRRVRGDLLAIYGFARLVDDAGDEAAGDRSALLDWIEGDVDRLYAGDTPRHMLIRALVPAVRAHAIPQDPFHALIAANRQDQVVTSYATYAELEDYCRLSANPVGHLVLHVLDAATPERLALSDHVCTGLQLTEHWQDVAEDLGNGRVYVPAEDLDRFGCSVEDLAAPGASPAVRELMAFEVRRARALLDAGAPLAGTLRGRPRVAVAAFVAGGRAALEAIAAAGYDVLSSSPRPSAAVRARALARALREAWRG
jgi:squalene synthase HpnC